MHILYRVSLSFLIFTLLLSVLTINSNQASAYYEGFDENNPPKLESISINNNIGKYKNEIEIKATILNASMSEMTDLALYNEDTGKEINIQSYNKSGDNYLVNLK